jgi:hypothetical protein
LSALLFPEALAEVLVGRVGQYGDDGSTASRLGFFAGDAQAGHNRCRCRDAHQQSFFARQPLDHVVGGFGLHGDFTICEHRVVDGRHKR